MNVYDIKEMENSPVGEPSHPAASQRKPKPSRRKVFLSFLLGGALLSFFLSVCALGYLRIVTEPPKESGTADSVAVSLRSAVRPVQMETSSGFRYPRKGDVGAALPVDLISSSHQPLPDDLQWKLSKYKFTEDGEVPPEFDIE